MRVIAVGNLVQRSWDDREGNKRTTVELQVEEVGPSLRRAKAVVPRTGGGSNAPQRSQEAAGGAYGGGQAYSAGPGAQTGSQSADVWGGQQTSAPF